MEENFHIAEEISTFLSFRHYGTISRNDIKDLRLPEWFRETTEPEWYVKIKDEVEREGLGHDNDEDVIVMIKAPEKKEKSWLQKLAYDVVTE